MFGIKTIIITGVVALSAIAAAVMPASQVSAATAPCAQRMFSYGANDKCVSYIQGMLNLANKAGLGTDNKFGTNTKNAVIAWQKKKGNIDVDGIVGPQTWGALCSFTPANGMSTVLYNAYKTNVDCNNAAKPKSCTQRTFSTTVSSNDACVSYIQALLRASGTDLPASNTFDAKTKIAITNWQKSHKGLAVDGIVGPQTWGSFCTTKSQNSNYAVIAIAIGCK